MTESQTDPIVTAFTTLSNAVIKGDAALLELCNSIIVKVKAMEEEVAELHHQMDIMFDVIHEQNVELKNLKEVK